jgi:hypothetical protein
VIIDSLIYQRIVIVPWNKLLYTIYHDDQHTITYATKGPWWTYLIQGLFSFNILWLLALSSLPLLGLTTWLDQNRFRVNVAGVTLIFG